MKTLDEVWALAESLNEEAHSDAWDSWIAADMLEDSDEEEDEDGNSAEPVSYTHLTLPTIYSV